MIANRETLKSWFQRGMKPLASQFAAWIDSYWHKEDTIPTANIEGLEATLNKKAELTDVNQLYADFVVHRADDERHKTAAEQGKLNNLAVNPNATYATREELEQLSGNSIIVIPADFTKGTTAMTEEMTQIAQERLDDGTLFKKPVYLLYSWKEDYTSEDAPVYYSLVPQYKEERTKAGAGQKINLQFNSAIAPVDAEYPDYVEAMGIVIQVMTTSNRVRISFVNYIDEHPVENIYLTEDENGIINSADKNWGALYKELTKGNHPQVSLKTPSSGMYCPVSYDFTLVEDSGVLFPGYSGTMEISYMKEVDGVRELWVETRVIPDFSGSGSYNFVSYLKKYPLSDVMRSGRIQVVDALPSGEGLMDGDIIILKQA